MATVRHRPEALELLEAQSKFTKKELQILYRGFKNVRTFFVTSPLPTSQGITKKMIVWGVGDTLSCENPKPVYSFPHLSSIGTQSITTGTLIDFDKPMLVEFNWLLDKDGYWKCCLNWILLLGFVFFFRWNGSISINASFFFLTCKLLYADKILFEATERPQNKLKIHVSGRGRNQRQDV